MSANWSKKYGRYAADSDADADAEADHLVEVLRHPKALAYLAGLIDGRLKVHDGATALLLRWSS